MSLRDWYTARGFRFICRRGMKLVNRYGLTPMMGIHRLERCMDVLTALGCAPTFPTPGYVVDHYPRLIRDLETRGAEIAVHSYEHVDLSTLPLPVAVRQLEQAIGTFERAGIEVHGFRCPYLGWSEALRDALPPRMFDYSSNQAICVEPKTLGTVPKSDFFTAVNGFYRGKPFTENLCLPTIRPNLIEIPVCVPDDLQLYDGLELNSEAIGNVWCEMLDHLYARGELFNLMFHPELASELGNAFQLLLYKANHFPLPVWGARLCEISDWWREKSGFGVEITTLTDGLRLTFSCTPRATVLARGMDISESLSHWDGSYYRLRSSTLDVPTGLRPFVGLPTEVSHRTVSFLHDQGYILDIGQTARSCGIYLDEDTLSRIDNEVDLVNTIEASSAPLVRFWRWPNGARSALCITGDLDAVSLLDYTSRLFTC